MTLIFIISAVFCFLHVYRDYLHSKKNYNSWFTRFGHFWDKPEYEIHGMIIFFILGYTFAVLAAK